MCVQPFPWRSEEHLQQGVLSNFLDFLDLLLQSETDSEIKVQKKVFFRALAKTMMWPADHSRRDSLSSYEECG